MPYPPKGVAVEDYYRPVRSVLSVSVRQPAVDLIVFDDGGERVAEGSAAGKDDES